MEQKEDVQITLPPVCVRLLNDKLFEKKKTACREIEILAKELNAQNKTKHIRKLIQTLVDNFINNTSPNSKIGGLVAVSSVAIALDNDAKNYLDDIVGAIFKCCYDQQRDVRYRALESLYNVAKSVRSEILVYFDDKIFDIIIRLGEDSDISIQEASLLMDKLIKDIVIENPNFNIPNFIDVIRQRLYVSKLNTIKLLLSWINFLDCLPYIDLLVYVDVLLDGLLKIACKTNIDVRRITENILDEFYMKIQKNPKSIDIKLLIKIILQHIQIDNQFVQNISLKWLNQLIKLGDENDIQHNLSHILALILPCLSSCNNDNDTNNADNTNNNDDMNNNAYYKNNIELAKCINENLLSLLTNSKTFIAKLQQNTVDNNNDDQQSQQQQQQQEQNEIIKIIIVLMNELQLGMKTSSQTKLAILEWLYQLYDRLDIKIDQCLEDKLKQILLQTLFDMNDNVRLLNLKVYCKIVFKQYYSTKAASKTAAHDNELNNYRKLIKPLLELFHNNQETLLNDYGSFIIRNLCYLLNAEQIYIIFSEILLQYNHKFICLMIYILNTILLTSDELFSVRNKLKNIENNKELFDHLYKTWSYSSISLISLCFLTKNYRLASNLILKFGYIHINLDILLEIDQLIQMLESPIFTSLRLDLLDSNNNYYLRKSLYGLLMLLPQTEAFHLLRKRLQCVPDFSMHNVQRSTNEQIDKENASKLEYFIEIQQKLDNFNVRNNNMNDTIINSTPIQTSLIPSNGIVNNNNRNDNRK